MELKIGEKDKPDYNSEELINIIKKSLFTFFPIVEKVTNYYQKILENKGLRFNKSGSVSLNPFY